MGLSFNGQINLPAGRVKLKKKSIYITAKYWRLRATSTSFDPEYPYFWRLCEVEGYNLSNLNGENIFTNSTVTASSYNTNYEPENVIDGETNITVNSTAWSSQYDLTEFSWIAFELPTSKSLRSLNLCVGTAYATAGATQAPQTFMIDYSNDGVNWSNLIELESTNPFTTEYWISYEIQ